MSKKLSPPREIANTFKTETSKATAILAASPAKRLGIKNHRKPDEKTMTRASQRLSLLTNASCTAIEAKCTAEGCHLGHVLRGYRDCLADLLEGRATVDDVSIWESALPRFARGLIVTMEETCTRRDDQCTPAAERGQGEGGCRQTRSRQTT